MTSLRTTTYQRRRRPRPRPLEQLIHLGANSSGHGDAILCFPPDGTFFRGTLTTREHTQAEDAPYALYGRESSPGQYTVTLVDLDTGVQSRVDGVHLRGKLRKHKTPTSITATTAPILIQSSLKCSNPFPENEVNFVNGTFENESIRPTVDGVNEDLFGFLDVNDKINDKGETGEEEDLRTTPPLTMFDDLPSSFSDLTNVSSCSPVELAQSLNDVTGASSSPVELPPYLDDYSSSTESPTTPSGEGGLSRGAQFSLDSEDEANLFQFTADAVYRGIKADMMIQQFMAGSGLVGSKCVVLSGPMRFCVNDSISLSSNVAWSL